MSATFGSVRECLAYLASATRGPRAARPRWSSDPSDDTHVRRDPLDHVLIGAVVHGPAPDGAGIGIDSDEWLELREWALSDNPRTPQVRRAEERLRVLLRHHGILRPPVRRTRLRRVDGEVVQPLDRRGSTVTTLRETSPRSSEADES